MIRKRSFVGTPEYVSPEILSDKDEPSSAYVFPSASSEGGYVELTRVEIARSDYWAFGCVLYQIIAGQPPFKARTDYLMFQQILQLDYQFPQGFPSAARDLIEKLLVSRVSFVVHLRDNYLMINNVSNQVLDPEQRLTVDAIKNHRFFTESPSMDFDTIWTIDPPPIETGLTKPRLEQKGEFVLVGEFDGEENDEQDGAEDEDGDDEREGAYSAEHYQDVGSNNQVTSRTEPATKW